uniref:NADH dehydrogenase subunit 4L n=1 Tax=China mantispoides TaxID=3034372 RepID=UPI0024115771|nr:NADH dehydrogenase subunit 4L [China mantispoides]WEL32776.1 NADH dehydrogenase subunit 4L [China mantispoides]
MFSLFMFLSMMIFFSGVYMFSSKRKHLLMVLLSLEYIVISLFFVMVFYFNLFYFNLFYVVIFMVLSVCEGVLGLSILVSMIRSHGSDYLNSFSLSLC